MLEPILVAIWAATAACHPVERAADLVVARNEQGVVFWYSARHSRRMIDTYNASPFGNFGGLDGPCLAHTRLRRRTTVHVIEHDGRCVTKVFETRAYELSKLEHDAGIASQLGELPLTLEPGWCPADGGS